MNEEEKLVIYLGLFPHTGAALSSQPLFLKLAPCLLSCQFHTSAFTSTKVKYEWQYLYFQGQSVLGSSELHVIKLVACWYFNYIHICSDSSYFFAIFFCS